jgi:hypothetical protein
VVVVVVVVVVVTATIATLIILVSGFSKYLEIHSFTFLCAFLTFVFL